MALLFSKTGLVISVVTRTITAKSAAKSMSFAVDMRDTRMLTRSDPIGIAAVEMALNTADALAIYSPSTDFMNCIPIIPPISVAASTMMKKQTDTTM